MNTHEFAMSDDFTVYTHEAGAGALSIAMEGPSKANIDFKDNKDGTCDVAYTCAEPGARSLFACDDVYVCSEHVVHTNASATKQCKQLKTVRQTCEIGVRICDMKRVANVRLLCIAFELDSLGGAS